MRWIGRVLLVIAILLAVLLTAAATISWGVARPGRRETGAMKRIKYCRVGALELLLACLLPGECSC